MAVQRSNLVPSAAVAILGSWEFLAAVVLAVMEEAAVAVAGVLAAVQSSWKEGDRPAAWAHRLAFVRASCSYRVGPSAVVDARSVHYLDLVAFPVACTAAVARVVVKIVVGPFGVAYPVVPAQVVRSGAMFPWEEFVDSRNRDSVLVILAVPGLVAEET